MAYFDLENVMQEIKDKLIDIDLGLNSRIAAINLEKAPTDIVNYGSSAAINLINNDDIYFLIANQVTNNTNQFLIFTIDKWEADELGAVTLSIGIHIVFTSDNDFHDNIKALRYMRALRQTLEYNRYASLPSQVARIKIIQPVAYKENDNKSWVEIGCVVETMFAQV